MQVEAVVVEKDGNEDERRQHDAAEDADPGLGPRAPPRGEEEEDDRGPVRRAEKGRRQRGLNRSGEVAVGLLRPDEELQEGDRPEPARHQQHHAHRPREEPDVSAVGAHVRI